MRISGLEFRRVLFRSVGNVVAHFGGCAHGAARPCAIEPVADADDAVFEAIGRCHRADDGCCIEGVAARGAEQQQRSHASAQAAHQVEWSGHGWRSEEHTSELQSLMRISYAVFCLKKKKNKKINDNTIKNSASREQKTKQ